MPTITLMSDDKIIESLQQHSEQALMELERKYGSYCYSIVYDILRSPWDAEECMNDVLWHCWKGIPQKAPRCLKAYLAAVSRNQAITQYRKIHANKRDATEYPLLWECTEIYGTDTDYVTALAVSWCLDSSLSTLSLENRQLFLRHYCGGETIPELAREFVLSEVCIRSRLMRIRNHLKRKLCVHGINVSQIS